MQLTNPLYSKVARKILTESLALKKGDPLTVETWNTGLAFAKEVVRQARQMGCIPLLIFEDERTYLDGVRHTPKDILGLMGRHERGMLAATKGYVFIPGPPLGAYYRKISTRESNNATRYNPSWYESAEKARLKGARLTFGYVGKDMARALGKPVKDLVDAQLKAALVDFSKVRAKGRAVAGRFKDGASVKLRNGKSELRFKLRGEVEIEDGIVDREDISSGANMTYVPPGFVAKGIEQGTATGRVELSSTPTFFGIAKRVSLEFEKGRLVKYSSPESQEIVDRILMEVPSRARLLSRFTVGLNDLLDYGFGQDRFVSGSVRLEGFGLGAMLQKADFTVDGNRIVSAGRLV